MKYQLIAVATLLSLLLGSSAANAGVYTVEVVGTITTVSGPGAPAGFDLGQKILLQARFDDSLTVKDDSTGLHVAALRDLPTDGEYYWRVLTGSHTYNGLEETSDSELFYHSECSQTTANGELTKFCADFLGRQLFGRVGIAWSGNHVLGLSGLFAPDNIPIPILDLGSTIQGGRDFYWDANSGGRIYVPPSVSSSYDPLTGQTFPQGTFATANYGLYRNNYQGPTSTGVWDFANSRVTYTPTGSIPEPSAWALMIGGFGGVGAVLRRRRASALA